MLINAPGKTVQLFDNSVTAINANSQRGRYPSGLAGGLAIIIWRNTIFQSLRPPQGSIYVIRFIGQFYVIDRAVETTNLFTAACQSSTGIGQYCSIPAELLRLRSSGISAAGPRQRGSHSRDIYVILSTPLPSFDVYAFFLFRIVYTAH